VTLPSRRRERRNWTGNSERDYNLRGGGEEEFAALKILRQWPLIFLIRYGEALGSV
jgi:hypothetical protein